MGTEKLKIKLELYATMWDLPPHAEVLIDDKSYGKKPITGTLEKPDLIEFEHEFEENKDYNLVIKRTNKIMGQTKVNEKGEMTADQLLHIKSLEIDEIDIGSLIFEGVYSPIYPQPWATQQKQAGIELPKKLKNVTQMGHDGEWRFSFTSPFYMWLLENLY